MLTEEPEMSQCQDWVWWSGAVGVTSTGGGYTVEFIFFICFSVWLLFEAEESRSPLDQLLFASCASFLVKQYAPQAMQSGIPEVKTVLGGFVMRNFLTSWTLTIKSVGLVSPQHLSANHVRFQLLSVSCGRIWIMAWEGGTPCSCRMLLRNSLPPHLPTSER